MSRRIEAVPAALRSQFQVEDEIQGGFWPQDYYRRAISRLFQVGFDLGTVVPKIQHSLRPFKAFVLKDLTTEDAEGLFGSYIVAGI